MSIILFIIVIALLAMIISSTVRIVPQAHAYVVERLGAYQGTWSVGLHVKVPFIDRVARKVNLKEQVVDFPPQPVITKDNVTMQIDTVVYFHGSKIIQLRCRESDHGDRESDSYNTSKCHW